MGNNKEQVNVAESQDNIIVDNTQTEGVVDNAKIENSVENIQMEKCAYIESQQKQTIKGNKKPLTPYQKYKQSKNQNGKKYFEFYDDIKVYTHNIYDW